MKFKLCDIFDDEICDLLTCNGTCIIPLQVTWVRCDYSTLKTDLSGCTSLWTWTTSLSFLPDIQPLQHFVLTPAFSSSASLLRGNLTPSILHCSNAPILSNCLTACPSRSPALCCLYMRRVQCFSWSSSRLTPWSLKCEDGWLALNEVGV